MNKNPYRGGIFPAGAEGKKELLEYWTPVPGRFDGRRFPIDEILATEDPSLVFVGYRGEIQLKDDAGDYKNNYFTKLQVQPI